MMNKASVDGVKGRNGRGCVYVLQYACCFVVCSCVLVVCIRQRYVGRRRKEEKNCLAVRIMLLIKERLSVYMDECGDRSKERAIRMKKEKQLQNRQKTETIIRSSAFIVLN